MHTPKNILGSTFGHGSPKFKSTSKKDNDQKRDLVSQVTSATVSPASSPKRSGFFARPSPQAIRTSSSTLSDGGGGPQPSAAVAATSQPSTPRRSSGLTIRSSSSATPRGKMMLDPKKSWSDDDEEDDDDEEEEEHEEKDKQPRRRKKSIRKKSPLPVGGKEKELQEPSDDEASAEDEIVLLSKKSLSGGSHKSLPSTPTAAPTRQVPPAPPTPSTSTSLETVAASPLAPPSVQQATQITPGPAQAFIRLPSADNPSSSLAPSSSKTQAPISPKASATNALPPSSSSAPKEQQPSVPPTKVLIPERKWKPSVEIKRSLTHSPTALGRTSSLAISTPTSQRAGLLKYAEHDSEEEEEEEEEEEQSEEEKEEGAGAVSATITNEPFFDAASSSSVAQEPPPARPRVPTSALLQKPTPELLALSYERALAWASTHKESRFEGTATTRSITSPRAIGGEGASTANGSKLLHQSRPQVVNRMPLSPSQRGVPQVTRSERLFAVSATKTFSSTSLTKTARGSKSYLAPTTSTLRRLQAQEDMRLRRDRESAPPRSAAAADGASSLSQTAAPFTTMISPRLLSLRLGSTVPQSRHQSSSTKRAWIPALGHTVDSPMNKTAGPMPSSRKANGAEGGPRRGSGGSSTATLPAEVEDDLTEETVRLHLALKKAPFHSVILFRRAGLRWHIGGTVTDMFQAWRQHTKKQRREAPKLHKTRAFLRPVPASAAGEEEGEHDQGEEVYQSQK